MSYNRIIAIGTALCLAALAGAAQVSAAPPEGKGNSYEDVSIQLNLTGVATQTDGGPNDGFTFYINASGEGVRRTPQGNGVQIKSDGLLAEVKVVRVADNVTVAEYSALVGFHAQQASSIAQDLEPGNFKFNLGLHGKRSENVLGIETGERVMAFNAHGSTLGPADDDGAHAVQGRGQTTLKDGQDGNGATHYNFVLGGTGSILSAA